MSAENATLRFLCAILYTWATTDPNPVTKEDKLAPGDVTLQMLLKGVKQSKYLYFALSILELYLGQTSPSPTRLHALQRVGFVTYLAGALFRLWAMKTLGSLFTFRLAVRKDHTLVREGPYSVVRHPAYIGAQIMIAGEFLMLLAGNIGQRYLGSGDISTKALCALAAAPAALLVAALVPRIHKEETMLAERFGTAWKRYSIDVPWRLVPLIY